MSVVSCTHEWYETGAIQTTFSGEIKLERKEYACRNCPRHLWLKTGQTLPSPARSSRKASGIPRNQLRLAL